MEIHCMPTYDYQCQQCLHTFEEVLKIDDRNLPTLSPCPQCNTEQSILLIVGSPLIADPIRIGVKKPHGAFTERMQEMKKRLGPKANIQV